MASVKLILRKDKVNKKSGKAPIYIRIIKNRKAHFVSIGVKVEPKFWNESEMTVKKGAKNYQQLNAYISKKRADAEGTALTAETSTRHMTTRKIKDEIIGKKPEYFFGYTSKRLENLKSTISISTYRSYKSFYKKLYEYNNNQELTFQDIDIQFIQKYEDYLIQEKGNSIASAKASIQFISTFFKKAIKEGIITAADTPFYQFDFNAPKKSKTYLNETQFEDLISYKKKTRKHTELFKDMFIFSCFAGGLRFFDVMELKWTHYNPKEQRITKIIHKTGRKHQFKLPTIAITILKKYTIKNGKNDDFIFPLLDNNFDYEVNEARLYTQVNTWNGECNKELKLIGTELDFPFKMTFHTSRHTFATRALNKGMRIEHVSKIMDHSDIQITQVYAKIVNEELDKAMEVLNE